MGNSRSQQTSVMSFYNDFHKPDTDSVSCVTAADDVDDESELFSGVAKMLPCPQCEELSSFQPLFYNDNSACKTCLQKLKKKQPITKKSASINYHGLLMDKRFPQTVAWNFGGQQRGGSSGKKSVKRTSGNDARALWKPAVDRELQIVDTQTDRKSVV